MVWVRETRCLGGGQTTATGNAETDDPSRHGKRRGLRLDASCLAIFRGGYQLEPAPPPSELPPENPDDELDDDEYDDDELDDDDEYDDSDGRVSCEV